MMGHAYGPGGRGETLDDLYLKMRKKRGRTSKTERSRRVSSETAVKAMAPMEV